MKYLMFFCLLCLTACGKDPVMQIQDILQNFNNTYNVNYNNPIILVNKMNTEQPNVVGMAFWGENNHIELLRSFWLNTTDSTRENLLFHELGHAALNLNHNNTINSNNCPKSIMNWQLLSFNCYNFNVEYYKNQLFDEIKEQIK